MKEIITTIKNTDRKTLLTILGIFYLTTFVPTFITCIPKLIVAPEKILPSTVFVLLWSIISPIICILACILFLPAIYPIRNIFRKTNDQLIRMFSIAFFIPFLNFIYFTVECLFSINEIFLSVGLGAILLFGIIPSIFWIFVFIPKKMCPFKWYGVLTTILAGILTVILMIFTFLIVRITDKRYYNPITLFKLSEYNQTINYIEDYKSKNGIYPGDIEEIKAEYKHYPFNKYELLNDSNDFILTVGKEENFYTCFRYCSNQELNECNVDTYNASGRNLRKIGKWVHDYYSITD